MDDVVWESPRTYLMHGYEGRVVRLASGKLRTVYVHREVMERVLGRPLERGELVHHRDGNKRNNAPANLELTTRAAHGATHATKGAMVVLVCAECGGKFERRESRERQTSSRRAVGPFCGKSCAARGSMNH